MRRSFALGSSMVVAASVLAAPVWSAVATQSEARPVVTKVTSNYGATVGYTHVVISGQHFTGTPKVTFGSTRAANVRVLSSHALVAYAPGHRHGVVQVRVETKAGTSPVSDKARYTYVHQVQPGSWQARTAPVPYGEPADDLVRVATACPTTTVCYSVGTYAPAEGYDTGASNGPLVSTQVSGQFTTQPAPLPPGVTRADASLGSISCPAVGSCVAAGSYDSGRHGLLLVLADGTWTASKADLHEGSRQAEVSGLSCGAPGECTAIGYRSDSSLHDSSPVLLRLHDGTWTTTDVVPPGGQPGETELNDVDCASASYCLASGSYGGGTKSAGAFVVQVVDGESTVRRIPNSPTDGRATDGENVRCPAVGRCTVLALFALGKDASDFVSVDNGNHFTFRRIDLPADADSHSLFGLDATMSCPAVSVCYAASAYEKKGYYIASVARLDGTKVHLFDLPRAVPGANVLVGDIDCASRTACTAVGAARVPGATEPTEYRGAYFTYADGVWTTQVATAAPGQQTEPTSTYYDAVDCPAPGSCTADGEYEWDRKYGPDEDGFYYYYFIRDSGLLSTETPN